MKLLRMSFISLFLIGGVALFIGCKSNDKNDTKIPSTSNAPVNNTNGSSSSNISIKKLEYEKIYLLIMKNNIDPNNPVLCRYTCNSIPKNNSNSIDCAQESSVYITLDKFSSNTVVNNFMISYQTEINQSQMNELEMLYQEAVKDKTRGDFDLSIGEPDDVCLLSKSENISDLHYVLLPKSSNAVSENNMLGKWIAYDKRLNVVKPSSSAVAVWKNTETGHYWTIGTSKDVRTITRASSYCSNLEFGTISSWILPNRDRIQEIDSDILPYISVTHNTDQQGWWISEVSNGNYAQYFKFGSSQPDKAFSQDEKRGVICVQ